MKKVIVALLVIAGLATSCKKNDHDKGVYKGQEVMVHNGKAWTWLKTNNDGSPDMLGVTINDNAMNSVPVGNGGMGDGDGEHNHDMDNSYVLPMHPQAPGLIKHVWLNWNPEGHEPPGIYDIPHFDIHYYLTSVAEREAAVDPVKMEIAPAAAYLPPTYIGPGAGVPTMGKHWLDATSPELNGALFTQTFIYGSYDSKVTFLEPMITKAFLLNTTSFERDIPQPAKFQQTGYYPTKMRVVKHDGVTEIILAGFVKRQAS